jgi:hypothetical protein
MAGYRRKGKVNSRKKMRIRKTILRCIPSSRASYTKSAGSDIVTRRRE